MRHLTLRLKGFIGIKSGQGKEEIVLDLEKYRDDQVIALVAENGGGKTTLVDNLHPYVTMPSYDTEGAAFSFYEHVVDGAEKQYDFELQGQRFRQLLKFKLSGKTRKVEAYLLRLNGGLWSEFVGKTGIVSDGKVGTYELLIEELCGPSKLYFTAIHQAQGKKALHTMPNGDVKPLLVSMLGLGDIVEVSKRAKDTARAIGIALEEPRAQVAATLEEIARIQPEQKRLMEESLVNVDACNLSLAGLDRSSVDISARITTLERTQTEGAATRDRIASLMREIEVASTANSQRTAELNQLKARESAVLADSVTRLNRQCDDAAMRARQLLESKKTLVAQIGMLAECQGAAVSITGLTTALQVAEAALAISKSDLDAETRKELLLSTLSLKIASVTKDGASQKTVVDGLTAQAATLESVPCKGSDLATRCDLLKIAFAASASLLSAGQKLVDYRAEYTSLAKEKLSHGELMVQAKKLAVQQAEQGVVNARESCQKAKTLVNRLPDVLGAIKNGASIDEQISANEKTRSSDLVELDALKIKLSAAAASHDEAIRLAQSQFLETDTRLRREIAELSSTDVTASIESAKRELSRVEEQRKAKRAELDSNQQRHAVAQARLGDLEQRFSIANQSLKALESAEAEQGHYLLLSKAFGNDGIVALLIDEAGPSLANIANTILLECYGPRFTIEIRTQIPNLQGVMKEGFEIRVHDAETGLSKPMHLNSGGQRVWINECIVRAISIYLAQQSGRSFDCLISDETDGALDEDRKRQFMAMKRQAMTLGKFKQEIFISQTPELWGMADRVIHINQL